jgi:hypothetical protein
MFTPRTLGGVVQLFGRRYHVHRVAAPSVAQFANVGGHHERMRQGSRGTGALNKTHPSFTSTPPAQENRNGSCPLDIVVVSINVCTRIRSYNGCDIKRSANHRNWTFCACS